MRPQHKHGKFDSIIVESDSVTLITELILRYDIRVLRYDRNSFFNTTLGFSTYWDHKNYIGYDNDYYNEENRKTITFYLEEDN